MKLKKKSAVYLLLMLFLTLVGETIIPHTHVEKENMIVPDFSGNDNQNETHDDDDGETLHSSFFHWSDLGISLKPLQKTNIVWRFDDHNVIVKSLSLANYNILPKVLNSQLFVIHICSSKSPPFLV